VGHSAPASCHNFNPRVHIRTLTVHTLPAPHTRTLHPATPHAAPPRRRGRLPFTGDELRRRTTTRCLRGLAGKAGHEPVFLWLGCQVPFCPCGLGLPLVVHRQEETYGRFMGRTERLLPLTFQHLSTLGRKGLSRRIATLFSSACMHSLFNLPGRKRRKKAEEGRGRGGRQEALPLDGSIRFSGTACLGMCRRVWIKTGTGRQPPTDRNRHVFAVRFTTL